MIKSFLELRAWLEKSGLDPDTLSEITLTFTSPVSRKLAMEQLRRDCNVDYGLDPRLPMRLLHKPDDIVQLLGFKLRLIDKPDLKRYPVV